ncbi:MAG: hypothetical protein IJ746_05980 [Ruminococcus sp.]|nr:hypothetical protein [Ruminococcus sp.]
MLKKITAVMAAAVMSLSLAACGSRDESSEQDKGVKIVTGSTTKTAPADNGDKADSKDPLSPQEQEPEEEQVTVKEYLMGGAWCYTDESFADIKAALETREKEDWFNRFYFMNTIFNNDGKMYSALCLIGETQSFWGKYWFQSDDEDEIYEAGKEYEIYFSFGFMNSDATLKDGRLSLDYVTYNYNPEDRQYGEDFYAPYKLETKSPITLVRKEKISQEEFEKDFPGRYRLVQNDYIFGEMYENDQKKFDYLYGGKTLTIKDDRTAVWEPDGKTVEVKYLGDEDVYDNAVVVGYLFINYLYMEHETFLYAEDVGRGIYMILEKIG